MRDSTPMPMPKRTSPIMSIKRLWAQKRVMAPIVNTAAAFIMVFRLPKARFMEPPNSENIKADTIVAVTMDSSCSGDRLKTRVSGRRAPLITPVLYPERNPPIAAMHVRYRIRLTTCKVRKE